MADMVAKLPMSVEMAMPTFAPDDRGAELADESLSLFLEDFFLEEVSDGEAICAVELDAMIAVGSVGEEGVVGASVGTAGDSVGNVDSDDTAAAAAPGTTTDEAGSIALPIDVESAAGELISTLLPGGTLLIAVLCGTAKLEVGLTCSVTGVPFTVTVLPKHISRTL